MLDHDGRATQIHAEVLKDFLARPAEMAEAAQRIRQGLTAGAFQDLPPETEGEDDFSALEGRLLLGRHRSRERNKGLRKKKIDTVLRQGHQLACEACGFDFERVYGDRGRGYIECHHVVPLHEAGEGRTKLSDLALICANCHRMIHRRAPWPTPEELRASIEQKHAGDRRAAAALTRPRRAADEQMPNPCTDIHCWHQRRRTTTSPNNPGWRPRPGLPLRSPTSCRTPDAGVVDQEQGPWVPGSLGGQ